MIENKFTDELIEIDFDKSYSKSESEILRKGVIAMSMDEKWNIIFEQNELNFYRSWTGIGIFKIKFEENEDKLISKNAYATIKFQEEQGSEFCSALLNWVIEVVLFGRKAELPRVKN